MARVNSGQYGTGGTVFSGRGSVSLVNGYNASANLRYIFFADAAAIAAATAVTAVVNAIAVGPYANFSWTPSESCAPMGTAFTWKISTTPNVMTDSADNFYVRTEAQSEAAP